MIIIVIITLNLLTVIMIIIIFDSVFVTDLIFTSIISILGLLFLSLLS